MMLNFDTSEDYKKNIFIRLTWPVKKLFLQVFINIFLPQNITRVRLISDHAIGGFIRDGDRLLHH